MTLEFQFRPIEHWPGEKTRSRQRSKFNTHYNKTLELLARELSHLRAKQIVIQADCGAEEIRRDGQLRADARLRGPGIILSFESAKGPLSFPCDTYCDWQDNLRAIALAMEALRSIDRYGVTRRAEQYKGWARLPAPDASVFPDAAAAASWVAVESNLGFSPEVLLRDKHEWRRAYSSLAGKFHPDRNCGADAEFKKLQAARELIERCFTGL